MKSLPNILLIAGTGRKVGKTSFACYLINHFSSRFELIGLKVSSHLHQVQNQYEIITKTDDYIIYREINRDSGKDSSRMLKAGASAVYFIESEDNHLADAFCRLLPIIGNQPVICESASLAKFVTPGILVFIENKSVSPELKNADLKRKADFIVHFFENSFDFETGPIQFVENEWKYLK